MSMDVAVNREGDRLLFLPYVLCWGIDRLTDRFFVSLRGADATAERIGEALEQAYAYIERTGSIEMDLEEQQNCWRHDTKYKTWRSFARNNDFVTATKNKDGSYYVCAYPPRNRDLVGDEVCSIRVPAGAPPVALGRAVLDAYAALDGWKAGNTPGNMALLEVDNDSCAEEPLTYSEVRIENHAGNEANTSTDANFNPRFVSVNREGKRLLILPCVRSWGTNRTTDRRFASLRDAEMTPERIGESVLDMFSYIESAGSLELSLEEQRNYWRHDTKYKTYRAFIKNNDLLWISTGTGGGYLVCAYPPRDDGELGDSIWHVTVPAGAPPVALGRAVLDAYAALDGWKAEHPGGMPPAAPPDASACACDGSVVTLPVPAGGFVEETPSAAEVLLQWSLPGRDGEPVAWVYLEEGDWGGPGGDGAWDEWVGRWRVSCGEPRSVSRGAWDDGGPFGVRWEARNASSLSIALVAPVGGEAAVRLCLDVESPGRRARMAARLEQALGDVARATRITPAPPEN